MKNPFLVGDRTYLRPVEREDAPNIVPWVNDAEIIRMLRMYRPISRESEEELIERMRRSDHDVLLGIAERGTDSLIGLCGLHQIDPRNRSCFFGIFIGDRSAWGKGHATEATLLLTSYGFDTLNLHRIELKVRVDNERALRVYKRVGFKKEGVLRHDLFRDGRYHDSILMSMIREDWEAKRANA